MDTLTLGKNNPRLADIRRAINGDTLTDDGLLPVEGPRLIREARNSGLEVAAMFVRSDVADAADVAVPDVDRKTPVYVLDQPAFRKIQTTESSQGLIALVRIPEHNLNEFALHSAKGPIVVLAGLQDPGNAGTIIRVAESFGASGCIGLSGTVGLFNSKLVRASAGSVFRVPCVWDIALDEMAAVLAGAGILRIGTSPHATDTIGEWDWKSRSAILIGNEGNGLSDEDLQQCDKVLRIPLCAPVESLNSAIAASVILYEAFQQRALQKGLG